MTIDQKTLPDVVAQLPGGWRLSRIVRHRDGVPRRFVARRITHEYDEETGDEETVVQYESRVDAIDLIENIHRRNVALGIEQRVKREEVALSA